MPNARRQRGPREGEPFPCRIHRFLEPCLLLILRQGRSHGYDLKAALGPFGLQEVNPSLVYRTLREMEMAGYVESEWDTESTAGPARRVYQLTSSGHQHLDQWAEDLLETDRVLHHFLDTVRQNQNPSPTPPQGDKPNA